MRCAVVFVGALAACSYLTVHPKIAPPRDCGSQIPVMVDGTASIGSLAVALAGFQSLIQEPTASKTVPTIAAVVGTAATTLFLVSSVHGQHLIRACTDAPVGADPETMTRLKSREAAYALTKQAAAAARAGDCATTRRLAPQVKDANAEFYQVVFLRDVAIARCGVQ